MIYFFHVMRTGGRSLIRAMMERFDDPDEAWKACFGASIRYRQVDFVVGIQGKWIIPWNAQPVPPFYFSWSHRPQIRCKLPKHVFTVTMLRDPIERFASMYWYMRKHRDHNLPTPTLGPYMKWLGEDLMETAVNFPAIHRLAMLHHFSCENNPVEAAENIRGLDLWFRLENIEWGFAQLGNELGLTLPIVHVGDGGRPLLGPEDQGQLRDIFSPEFRLLEILDD